MNERRYIAIEAGASHCAAGLYAGDTLVAEGSGGPCNPTAYGIAPSVAALVEVARRLLAQVTEDPGPLEVYAAIAGVAMDGTRNEIGLQLCEALGAERAIIAGDLHPILWANAGAGEAVLVVAGTGSNVMARRKDGSLLQIGGKGAVLGDDGSAYRIAVSGLRAASDSMDGLAPETALVDALVHEAGLRCFSDFVEWTARAGKGETARLARAVLRCAEAGDTVADACVAFHLARLTEHVRVALERAQLSAAAPIYIHGGLFRGAPLFRQRFLDSLARTCGRSASEPTISGHRAVLILRDLAPLPPWAAEVRPGDLGDRAVASSEQPNAAPPLDTLDARGIDTAMQQADEAAVAALRACSAEIARAIEWAAHALSSGGRLLYTGAGTSGRLAVLDASECPPTFGVSPERVRAVIAGGEKAVRESVEGAEDDEAAGARDLLALTPSSRDLVLGIAASGTTPYTLAALRAARGAGASTVLLACNPAAQATAADLVIAVPTGPEVLPGSTRLKAGTATKLVLNRISTGALTLAGYVYGGRMVCMRPVNAKLRQRALRIFVDIAGGDLQEAQQALEAANWELPVALLARLRDLPPQTARTLLQATHGSLREAHRQETP